MFSDEIVDPLLRSTVSWLEEFPLCAILAWKEHRQKSALELCLSCVDWSALSAFYAWQLAVVEVE